ncbi:transcription factor TFIIIB complex subunit Brf1, putative [Talaromyces stipitatus ATCC 10500]|uniref:B-related factor 1 n=1 Tax=Talaromyces stipitatus (strain ATCC 10500 / CBS 375.48 / QM 6759 / NRRL 1006) TaxID=441959 RepID=B8M7Y5_TALSN|nr:transcription factor TFIIIB complex subunit Brf1, putative [Talaromyces stipitatus ATCC 10500]EED19864.1 transcription factor TFIIIB complex subunit Brf1, putative [Talaromyces stipitatus ATCC 10500]
MPLVKPPVQPRSRQPVSRLHSIKPPQSGGIPLKRPQGIPVPRVGSVGSSSTSNAAAAALPSPLKRPENKKPAETCPNPNCPDPRIIRDEEMKVCETCGAVVSEDHLVSEISFGETSAGAAVVQGSYVGADQTHTRSSGPGFHRGGGMESREITEQNGARYIQQMALALDIPESAQKAAGQVFKLAVGLNFIQGRRTKTVAAVCLYIACRRQPGNTVMLIDLSDVLMINVFKVGRAYKMLLEELRLGGTVFTMNPVDPENLILRFARQLEFGNKTMHVAKEAARIVQRMNRDWMTTGRRPAGICGAALILAARMNNFRRTVREVVYVVKVTEVTINQRLNEFSSTDSGDLTVDQFRSVHLETAHDPPSFNPKKKEGRKRKAKVVDTAAEIEESESETETEAQPAPPPAKRPRVDADGFAIPEIPIDPALTAETYQIALDQDTISNIEAELLAKSVLESEQEQTSKKGKKKQLVPEPTPEELASEEALENEMHQFLANGSDMVEAATAKMPVTATAAAAPTTIKARAPISDNVEIEASEFESDPEVANCLLSPAEVEIKERIWVHENRDYLRTQQAKALKRALSQGEDDGTTQKKPRKRRKGRLGDVTYLQGEDGKGSRASTPAEATRLMLEQRGYSKKINYKMLFDLYGDEGAAEAEKAEAQRQSRSQSVASEAASAVSSANIKPLIASTITPKITTSSQGGFNEADYDDEEDDAEGVEAGGEDRDDDQDIENAFAGNYDEDDYYEGSDYEY